MNGLVGSRSLVNITIGGIQHECLIDSGSQVTTISKSFHDTYLPSHPICPLDNIIEVEGAAGQRVAYIGYIEVDILFPEIFTGRPKTISTLALIVPDSNASVQVSLLIGTNSLDILFEGFDEDEVGLFSRAALMLFSSNICAAWTKAKQQTTTEWVLSNSYTRKPQSSR